jgi:hypothetical protein
VEAAPIKSQCSRDYFYTKNPIFEQSFSEIEREQNRLLSDIIASQSVPARGPLARGLLSSGVMFQAGRTAMAVANVDHMTNQFGKALLRHHLTKEGDTDLLEYLPKIEITMTDAVMDAVGRHLTMWSLIDDLDVGSEEAPIEGLASVRRSNGTCGFPAFRFHEWPHEI